VVLGPDHPDTLTTRNNLTYWRERRRTPPINLVRLTATRAASEDAQGVAPPIEGSAQWRTSMGNRLSLTAWKPFIPS